MIAHTRRIAALVLSVAAWPLAAQSSGFELVDTAIRFADGVAVAGDARDAAIVEGALDLSASTARLTFAADHRFAVRPGQAFTLSLELRTSPQGFCTPLMCRAGGAVFYSFVIGREPGRISFEAWNWSRSRATSRRRIDDGAWHRVDAVCDPAAGRSALFVDGRLAGVGTLDGAPDRAAVPGLRLGDNLDPNVRQHFDGALRAVRLVEGIDPAHARAIDVLDAARVLAPGEAARRMVAWNDRLRIERAPTAADAADWERRAASIRAQVQDALGLWPAPYSGERLDGRRSPRMGGGGVATDFARFEAALPLDLRRGAVLARDGHRITRVAWQAFAGFYATGWLYEPAAAATAPRPALLCPHGHWGDGARAEPVVARAARFAKNGGVALAVDSIHLEDLPSGLSSVGVMTWHNLRALEYLRSRDDVDPQRIASTGASGGGQQTYYLAALDSGLAAAAPVVMAAHFAEITAHDGVHCRCNHVPHLAAAVDMPEMAAAFAPRPQLFVTVDGDWTHRFHERGFPAVAAIYAGLGASRAVDLRRFGGGHRFDRPMRDLVLGWLGDALSMPLPEPEPSDLPSARVLAAAAAIDVPRDTGAIVAEFRARLGAPPDDDAERVRARLAALFDRGREPFTVRRAAVASAAVVDAWRVDADADVVLPVLRPAGGPQPGTAGMVAIIVAEAGAAATLAGDAAWIDALHDAGCDVLLADVRYLGELDAGAGWRDAHGRFRGVDEGVLACRDLLRVVAAVPSLCGGARPVALIGLGAAGASVLHAAAVAPPGAIVGAAAPDLGPTWAEGRTAPRTSRILLHADLPDTAAVARVPVAVGGVRDAGGWPARARLRVQVAPLTPRDVVGTLIPDVPAQK